MKVWVVSRETRLKPDLVLPVRVVRTLWRAQQYVQQQVTNEVGGSPSEQYPTIAEWLEAREQEERRYIICECDADRDYL